MAGEGGAGDELFAALFDPFSAGEAVAGEVIEEILSEGGRALYESYLAKKSYSFASEAVTNLLVSELRMCFVRFDEGEKCLAGRSTQASVTPHLRDASDARSPMPMLMEDKEQSEDREGWTLEQEPQRCRVDTWARACVPIRRKLVRPKAMAQDDRRGRQRAPSQKGGNSAASAGRAPSRTGQALNATGGGIAENSEVSSTSRSQRVGVVPIDDDREEDEEEAVLRDMKDREARRRRDEEQKVQRKVAQEAEDAARLAQVKDQMKNKPFTYDSQGSIIWVQPLQLNKLPSTNPAPSFAFKKDTEVQQEANWPRAAPAGGSAFSKSPRGGSIPKRKAKAGQQEFQDSFRRFAAAQPLMMETMKMAPGVELSERGAHKRGPDEMPARHLGAPMSRKDYEAMVASGVTTRAVEASNKDDETAGPPSPKAADKKDAATPRAVDVDKEEQPKAQLEAARAAATAAAAAAGGEGPAGTAPASPTVASVMKVVRAPDLGADLIPHAPTAPRPVQPVPPPSVRRVQMKRDALGAYALTPRERVNTGGGSRFPNCAAQPPLGATMGHGLHAAGKTEDYYFPGSAPANAGGLPEDEIAAMGSRRVSEASLAIAGAVAKSEQGSPVRQGQIVSQNPELARMLFAN